MNNDALHPPTITWDDRGQPKSVEFDDFYFNTDSGLDECRYVFLEKNKLHSRWQSLTDESTNRQGLTSFTIAETGFGTGLNFLAAWQLWLHSAPHHASLHFISIEKYPLSHAQMAQALVLWPELKPQADALLAQYPLNLDTHPQRVHRLHFHGTSTSGSVTLTLIFDDALEGLKQLLPCSGATPCVALQQAHYSANAQKVDAWFLDGFSPAKNPAMWQPALYALLAQLSKKGTTLATFTAIKSLREGLADEGFSVHKATGFGKKREMVTAVYHRSPPRITASEAAEIIEPNARLTQPKASRQRAQSATIPSANWHLTPTPEHTAMVQRIAVIGAGLAGSHTAYALAKQGLDVTVFDEGAIASGASGNAQGVIYTRFSHQRDTLADFNHSALPFADHFYSNHNDYARFGARTGVLHLAKNAKQQALQQTIAQQYSLTEPLANNMGFSPRQNTVQWCDPNAAATLAGVPLGIGFGGLYTPYGGWLQPSKVCQALLSHPNIQVHCDTKVQSLKPFNTGWQLELCKSREQQQVMTDIAHEEHAFDAVVIANAHSATQFSQTHYLHLKPIRGQITQAILPTSHTLHIKTCICGDGHVAPPLLTSEQQAPSDLSSITFGATFSPKDSSPQVTSQDNTANLKMLSDLIQLPANLHLNSLKGRVSFRCTTRDYLPFVGPVANAPLMLQAFSRYTKNKYAIIDSPGQYHRNLFVNVGHGSRGLAYTPLCAELLSSIILGNALPISQTLYKQLHPSRFLIRDLAQNKVPLP
ncbi:bifunctional tRNA (5-methylaminomethyl-2-thiouridine)(34)-methyltransferase MnmD/FAD-dependent 5-carboxymethylaminomethyl-2-thiouridine(34) oxidoreductase MnmC [Marinagarivorans algicola]|uniref:bifunctional tRNA (5-methylaminomethyl-2-thiouridine)(34)-methyltransferase MnmD/FAD-dependent 5-carboxymethylaminomethyl-2-thiouridine(34) oxidoreductase MnmC n=1 Tax=Marinagarivorans algicola TaxID=1513270 RepID=UPI0006BA0705|nr:bifunctional tRNA (5-methylaminomethyl-2-thiouridine)(34)-methyltransferase MnmD/FAD-dependent 5-carboxymethylaminomethyl-2-thiouridine(34) oxidoreductase MnmC [Marinagarivorans algicola]